MSPTRLLRTTSFRLAAAYAALFGASVVLLFVVVYVIAGDVLDRQLAAGIRNETAALVEDYRTGGLAHAGRAIDERLAAPRRSTLFYALMDADGRRVAGNLSAVPPREGWQMLSPPEEVEEPADDDAEDDENGRLLALGTVLADGAFLLVGEDAHPIAEVKEAIALAFAWAFGIGVFLAIGGGAFLSARFLRRVDAVNRTSRAIVEGNLAERIPTRGTGDEMDRLAANLNDMLDRIQTLMEGLRQVSSDIAHDLRTPMSRLRQRLEAARLQAGSITEYETAVDRAIADADAILSTFGALLRIAQIEAGVRRTAFADVDLSEVFERVTDAYAPVAEDLGHRLAADIEPGIMVRGDRDLLAQMLANVIENALRHTPPDSSVSIALFRRNGAPVGEISDDGPGIPESEREKVFRRFYRLDASRSTAGSGLGLALVAAVAALHGIRINLCDNRPGLAVILQFSESAPS